MCHVRNPMVLCVERSLRSAARGCAVLLVAGTSIAHADVPDEQDNTLVDAREDVRDAELALNPNFHSIACGGGGLTALSLAPGSERTVTGTLEGRDEAQRLVPSHTQYCAGYVGAPQFCLPVQRSGEIWELEVVDAGGVDSVLVLEHENPLHTICDDDGGSGLLSFISGELPAGSWQVRVGSYSHGARGTFRLRVRRVQ